MHMTNGSEITQENAVMGIENAVNWQKATQASSSSYDLASRLY